MRLIQNNMALLAMDWRELVGRYALPGLFLTILGSCGLAHQGNSGKGVQVIDDAGAIVRMDTTQPHLYLIFSGHDHNEGRMQVLNTLTEMGIKASFFFTGEFYRNEHNRTFIETLIREDHYLGAHSDQHLLYADWNRRDSTLVSRDSFHHDLVANYHTMVSRFGIARDDATYYLPPFEWYNREIATWVAEMDLTLINLTPGPGTARDYTWPQMDHRYASSQTIIDDLMAWEAQHTLNGVILLIHLGTDPRREDKLYHYLADIIHRLKNKGYQFHIF